MNKQEKMTWAPSTKVGNDSDDIPTVYHLIPQRGSLIQTMYEALPKSMFGKPSKQEQGPFNEFVEPKPSKADQIRAGLAMMEKIQSIAKTKPLGENASLSDWDDTSTVEKEAIAMVNHFGSLSVAGLLPKLKKSKPSNLPVGKNRKPFTLITDPEYFQPCKPRKLADASAATTNSAPGELPKITNEQKLNP